MSLSAVLQTKLDDTIIVLKGIAEEYLPATFANSFGAEDMVLTDLINQHDIDIEIFSLDTGRLPAETYQLMQKVSKRYSKPVVTYFPQTASVENYIQTNGPNAFYDSIELRQGCCFVRKAEPLRRAIANKKAWVTGIRREQAVTRADLPIAEWDADNGLQKFSPLVEWSESDVWEYLRDNKVPYNELHDKNYPSIGCAPCTRAIAAGEDIRAGRWWWENPQSKECGLHA
ncbi:MAG: phosphoadenylyl-sulfate reductase [Gammaproteobacteria bacterium]|nr:MAG: phosphoadenylyl-sulfate reductase [Gammaproteobacteria bacterium]PCH64521.1 MAG: phosphoadenylyl-sulfate reductase [Gammaproteobacteria bacterium]